MQSPVAASRIDRLNRGFSLIELLVVMALIALMSAIGAGAYSGLQTSDHKKALIHVSNALEIARQAAVAYNTYAYVGFTSPVDPRTANTPLCVAAFVSASGTDVLHSAMTGSQPLLAEGESPGRPGSWRLLSKPLWLRHAQVESTTTAPLAILPASERIGSGFSETIDPLAAGAGFSITRHLGSMTTPTALKFDRIVTFSPSGTAFVDNSLGLPTASIGVLLRPCRNLTPTSAEEAQTAAILINGLLGSARIYQYGTL